MHAKTEMGTHLSRASVRSLAVLLAMALSGCLDEPAPAGRYVIHGVVTDKASGAVLSGVEVTLLAEKSLTATTPESGYFAFRELAAAHQALLQFKKEGYEPLLWRVDLTEVLAGLPREPAATPDGGEGEATRLEGPVLVDASVALQRLVEEAGPRHVLEVGGWIYGGGQPARGATVVLWDHDAEEYVHEGRSDDSGRYRLRDVVPGHYSLRVWPHDRDGNGVAEFRLFSLDLGRIDQVDARNLTNITVHLSDAAPELQAASFVALSTRSVSRPTGYPLTAADLTAGVSGVLPTAGRRFFLHWGSEVDTASAVFELRHRDEAGRVGAVLGSTVTWQSNHVVAEINSTQDLVSDGQLETGYVLQISSLRFKDGTVLFAPGVAVGRFSFDVWKRPQPPENPTPALHLANRSLPGRAAAQVAFDAAGAWLLDESGDFLRGYSPADHWTNGTGLQLTWPHVPGAASYRLYARNTRNPAGAPEQRQWRPVEATFSSSWNLDGQTTIYASGVMQGDFGAFGPAGTGFPWLFGNGVELAVVSVQADGFEAPIDPAKALTFADTTAPMIVAVNGDYDGAGPLARTPEAGASFRRNFLVEFSEPMNTAAEPVLTLRSGMLTLEGVERVAWAPLNPDTPSTLSDRVAFTARLRTRGACTPLTQDRIGSTEKPGDRVLLVSDASLFSAGPDHRVIFVTGGGSYVGEARNISSVHPATGQVVLAAGLDLSVSAGTLACLATAAGTAVQVATSVANVPEADAADLRVANSSLFYRGQKILVFRAKTTETPAVLEVRIVSHVDTVERTVRVEGLIDDTHGEGTVLLPFDFVPEYVLRPRRELTLVGDLTAPTEGEIEIPLVVAGALEAMKGDALVLDLDGDLTTTTDRIESVLKEVRFVPAKGTAAERFSVFADLPTGTQLLRGVSRVFVTGDAFRLGGVRDTSQTDPAATLNPRRDAFSFEPGSSTAAFLH